MIVFSSSRIRRPHRVATRFCLVTVLALGTTVMGIATAAAAPAVDAGASADPGAVGPRAPLQGAAPKKGSGTSIDWAGYAVTGATFTTASGSWTQPGVSCTGKVTQSAFWVGIDGYASTDPTVQQIGTDADCTKGSHKVPGGPSYYAWFEMFPGSLVVLNTATYPLSPGDGMSASVTIVGSNYQLVLTDAGRWSFSTTQSAPSPPQNASAEWIVEAPTVCKGSKCQPVALADFGAVGFTGATANGKPVNGSGFAAHQITMTKNKKGTIVKASTSSLGSGGDSFNVTWVSN